MRADTFGKVVPEFDEDWASPGWYIRGLQTEHAVMLCEDGHGDVSYYAQKD